jgi:hypothetical protein
VNAWMHECHVLRLNNTNDRKRERAMQCTVAKPCQVWQPKSSISNTQFSQSFAKSVSLLQQRLVTWQDRSTLNPNRSNRFHRGRLSPVAPRLVHSLCPGLSLLTYVPFPLGSPTFNKLPDIFDDPSPPFSVKDLGLASLPLSAAFS